ncbi:hypothetical protein E2320_022589 [Naja naja]|nr:hypothetical protein E2320_022589 [Naja naja]
MLSPRAATTTRHHQKSSFSTVTSQLSASHGPLHVSSRRRGMGRSCRWMQGGKSSSCPAQRSAAGYSPERAMVAAGEFAVDTAAVILAQEGISLVHACAQERDEREKRGGKKKREREMRK